MSYNSTANYFIMKYLALLLLLALAACKSGSENTKQATKIDNLATNAEVQAYVRTVSKYYESFTLNDFTAATSPEGRVDEGVKKIIDENNITQPYIKQDFDNNGYTDLLVNGIDNHVFYQCLLLMSYGSDKVEITDLISHNFANPVITHAVTLDGMPGIRMHRPNPPRPKGKQVADSITNLCYKFGGFVEYNPKPAQHKIEKIQFATSMCYGLCPKFQMNVDAGRHAQFSAVAYNYHGEDESKTLSGFYTGTIDAKAYSQVVDILNYIDFEKLTGVIV